MHRAAPFFVAVLLVLVLWYGWGVVQEARRPSSANGPTLTLRETDPSRGPANAAVTVVEFSDFACPFCRTSANALDAMEREFPDSLRRVWKDAPTAEHAQAEPAARAARCAGEQGKFWEMHDALFAKQKELGASLYTTLAGTLGLDGQAFTACLSGSGAVALVAQSLQDSRAAYVDGVPTVFVNGVVLTGTVTQSALRSAISAALAGGT